MNKIKVGVVGCGFVGSAVTAGFSLKADIKAYDKDPSKSPDTLRQVCEQDIIFLCLPTPMRKSDGFPEMSYIHEAILDIQSEIIHMKNSLPKILVIKSTVLPGTNRLLQDIYPRFRFVSNPEFLTARSARLDFINTARIVLGGDLDNNRWAVMKINELYREVFLHTPIYMCSWEEAEMVKYMSNCFFALKVSYLNEIYKVCKKLDCDYDFIKKAWLADGRIGNSHHEVPGHDGDFGFGGPCFPKDIRAFVEWSKIIGTPIETLDAAMRVNDKVRAKTNWEVYDDAK